MGFAWHLKSQAGNLRDQEPRQGGTKAMSLEELETAVTRLPAGELEAFARWFADYRAGGARDHRGEAEGPVAVYISPRAYLGSMFLLAWTALRHPFTTTIIDVTHGRVIEP